MDGVPMLTSSATRKWLAAQPDHPPRKGKLGPPATKHLLDLGHFHPGTPTGPRILRGATDRNQTDIMEHAFPLLFWANSHCPSETQLQCHLPDPSLIASPPSPSGCLCVASEPHHRCFRISELSRGRACLRHPQCPVQNSHAARPRKRLPGEHLACGVSPSL